jgi:hypothetical protein
VVTQQAPNLLPFVPFSRIVICLLHMHMRITERIYHCIISGVIAARYLKPKEGESEGPIIAMGSDNVTDKDMEAWVNEELAPIFQEASSTNCQFTMKVSMQ